MKPILQGKHIADLRAKRFDVLKFCYVATLTRPENNNIKCEQLEKQTQDLNNFVFLTEKQ